MNSNNTLNTNLNILKNNICNNCGKQGHLFHQCKLPITSYGIIAFRYITNTPEYLMIRRKDSFGYIDFVRGKYTPQNIEQVQNIFNEMSVSERQQILNNDFAYLWKEMWGEANNGTQFKSEEIISQKKFDLLKNGIILENGEKITIVDIVNKCTTNWQETEWEFPKGRRNYQEKEIDCALREFEEETGIPINNLKVIENLLPFEEIFIGSNNKSYKHKYYIAFINKLIEPNNNYQITEVSKLEWKTLELCLESIRPYHLEKRQLITNVDKMLQEYRVF
jgi:8-oxo-dGTP pyrophosphatase MutT (NUDIX family)